MRDVILVRKSKKLKASKPKMGHFENTYDVMLGGQIPVSVDRGWVSVEAKVKGSKRKRGARFHFVNAHLEAFGDVFTTPGDEGAYNALTRDFGAINLGTRQTCCYPDVFAPIIGGYRFDHTVDHVMVKPRVRQLNAYVTGDDPAVSGAGGVVASDHGGLVSKLKRK